MKKLLLLIFFFQHSVASATPFQQLQLSPAQLKQIDKIRQLAPKEMKNLRQELFLRRKKLQKALANPDATDENLKQLFAAVREQENKIIYHKFERMLKIRTVLSAQQKAKAAKLFLKVSKGQGHCHGPQFNHRMRKYRP